MRDAGLQPPTPSHNPAGVPLLDLLDVCVEWYGVVPIRQVFFDWCAVCDLSVALELGGWSEIVERLRARRAERDATLPALATSRAGCEAMPDPDEAARLKELLGGPSRRRLDLTSEDCVESVRRYLADHLPPGTRPTVKHYASVCREQGGFIWPSNFPRICGRSYSEVVQELQR